MRTAFIGSNTTRHPFIFYLIAAVVYLAITLISQAGVDQAERMLRLRARK
jgi:octopine/nopaline transport system permease protein